jgi:phosphoribosylformylglycinamidine synthase
MEAVAEFAARGGPVLGICNGFQVLCEAGLLPAPCCSTRACASPAARSTWSRAPRARERALDPGQARRRALLGAGGDARRARGDGQVAFRYAPGQNPNGSARDIAGVRNEAGNVLGLMPHPEHAVDAMTGRPTACGSSQAVARSAA